MSDSFNMAGMQHVHPAYRMVVNRLQQQVQVHSSLISVHTVVIIQCRSRTVRCVYCILMPLSCLLSMHTSYHPQLWGSQIPPFSWHLMVLHHYPFPARTHTLQNHCREMVTRLQWLQLGCRIKGVRPVKMAVNTQQHVRPCGFVCRSISSSKRSGQTYRELGFNPHAKECPHPQHLCQSVCVWVFTGRRPEDALMGLASGPWGVEYRLLALCSAAVVLQIWVK